MNRNTELILFLEQTLIPDLKDSGTTETAATFQECVDALIASNSYERTVTTVLGRIKELCQSPHWTNRRRDTILSYAEEILKMTVHSVGVDHSIDHSIAEPSIHDRLASTIEQLKLLFVEYRLLSEDMQKDVRHRVYVSTGDYGKIVMKDTEVAFRAIADKLLGKGKE